MPAYKTISEGGEAEYEIQKSRFIAHTSHVTTEHAAQDFIRTIKKKHFDARKKTSQCPFFSDSFIPHILSSTKTYQTNKNIENALNIDALKKYSINKTKQN